MKRLLYSSIVVVGLSFGGCDSNSHLTKAWESSKERLMVPESVIYDKSQRLIFASNVNGEANPWQNNHGFISKLNRKGKVLELKWVKNLKSPKGLTLGVDGHLFVADLDRVVDINSTSGEIIQIFQAPKGINRLNDITYDEKRDIIFVSDSKTKEIYQISKDGNFSLFYNREKSKNAEQNGLLVDEDLLIMQGEVGKLKYLNIDTKHLSTITDNLDISIDGITKYRDLGYIVSTWSGGIYFVSLNGEVKELFGNEFKTADIFYSEDLDLLLIPDFSHSIRAYRVEGLEKRQENDESQPLQIQIVK